MTITLIILAILVGLGFLAVAARDLRPLQLSNEDAAFTGSVKVYDLTPERVAEIEHLVDRVSVIRVDLGTNRRNQSVDADLYEVFVIDVDGAFHDVGRFYGPEPAAVAANSAAERLNIPVDDPLDLLPTSEQLESEQGLIE